MEATTDGYDAFVSYSRKDRDLIKPVVQLLEVGGRRVFWDEISLRPGDPWQTELDAAIRSAPTFMILWCCHAAGSEWVGRETEIAARHGKTIIPVMLCSLPLAPVLAERQGIDCRATTRHECEPHPPGRAATSMPSELTRFVSAVGARSLEPAEVDRAWQGLLAATGEGGPPPAPAPPRPELPRPSRRRWVWVLAMIALLIGLVLIFGVTWGDATFQPAGAILLGLGILSASAVMRAKVEPTAHHAVQASHASKVLGLALEGAIRLQRSGRFDAPGGGAQPGQQ